MQVHEKSQKIDIIQKKLKPVLGKEFFKLSRSRLLKLDVIIFSKIAKC